MGKLFLKQKLTLLSSGFILLITSIDSFGNSKIVLGSFYVIAGLLNLAAVKIVEKFVFQVNIALNFLNGVLMFLIAYDFIISGKKYLPYAYLIAGVTYIFVSVIFVKKIPVKEKSG